MTGSHSHPKKPVPCASGFQLFEIQPEVDLAIYEDQHIGYHQFGNDWWVNGRSPFSFQYLSPDSLYPPRYFGPETGHPNIAQANELYNYMQAQFKLIFGRPFSSVIELGTGGGEITQCFHAAGLDYLAVEGTSAGVDKLRRNGIDEERIYKCNLKFMPVLQRGFELAMCTEVAEHIEPFFASKIVDNCTKHSNAVWFSAADRNRLPHYHHMNEQDIEVWDNLFATMGFRFFVPLDGRFGRASRLYLSQDAAGMLVQTGALRD